ELVPNGRFVWDLIGTEIVRRLVVDLADLGNEGLEYGLGLHAVVAAFKIDVVGLEAVLGADRGPKRFLLGHALSGHIGVLRPEPRTQQEAQAGTAGGAEEVAFVHRPFSSGGGA